MKVSLSEELGRPVTVRAGTESWAKPILKEPYFAGPPPVAASITGKVSKNA